MSSYHLTTAALLAHRIDAYFDLIQGEFHLAEQSEKDGKSVAANLKIWDREPEPATFAGLCLFLDLNSLQEFETYENKGQHATVLKRGRLRIEANYEKKLHGQSAAGAIFALKSMGWRERPEVNEPGEEMPKILAMHVTESDLLPAASEKDVEL